MDGGGDGVAGGNGARVRDEEAVVSGRAPFTVRGAGGNDGGAALSEANSGVDAGDAVAF